MSQGNTDLIGLHILLEGDKESGIKDLVTIRFDDDMSQTYLPLFTDKFAARRFMGKMNKHGATCKLQPHMIKYTIEMCRENNYIIAIDIVEEADGKHSFKRVDLSGN